MNLYLIEWIEEPREYDMWIGFVVAAESVDAAHQEIGTGVKAKGGYKQDWAMTREETLVTLIGTTAMYDKATVILDSYKAG